MLFLPKGYAFLFTGLTYSNLIRVSFILKLSSTKSTVTYKKVENMFCHLFVLATWHFESQLLDVFIIQEMFPAYQLIAVELVVEI